MCKQEEKRKYEYCDVSFYLRINLSNGDETVHMNIEFNQFCYPLSCNTIPYACVFWLAKTRKYVEIL